MWTRANLRSAALFFLFVAPCMCRYITFQQPAGDNDSEAKRAGSSDVRKPSPSASAIMYPMMYQ